MKPSLALIVPALALAACGTAADESPPAQEMASQETAAIDTTDPEVAQNVQDSIRARQTHLKQVGAAMKGISDELRRGQPAVDVIQGHAATIRGHAPDLQGWFPEGSGAEAGLKTEAREEIWADPEGFRQAAQELVVRSERFHATAQTGDLAAIRAGVRDLGGACKACHDRFRQPH